jgi:hypothetical protein
LKKDKNKNYRSDAAAGRQRDKKNGTIHAANTTAELATCP